MNICRRTTTIACALTAALGSGGAARADVFDDNGKGFQVGIGLGASRGALDIAGSSHEFEPRDPAHGAAVTLSLGYGLTERFAIHWATHAQGAEGGDESFYIAGINGLGASYRFASVGPTLYLSSTLGVSVVEIEDADERSLGPEATGLGVRGALGYQFGNGLRLEGGLMHVEADGGFLEADDEIELTGGELVLGWVWY